MENLSFELLLLAFLGMVIHILMKVASRKDKKTNKISLKVWAQDKMNWIRLALSILSTLALMIMSPDVIDMFGIKLSDGSPAIKVFAFGAGYLNHSIIRNVLKAFKKSDVEPPSEEG